MCTVISNDGLTMGVEVLYSPAAIRDLDSIWKWIAIENEEPGGADRVIADILERVDTLADFPLSSTPLDARCSIRSDWRFVESHGYLVFVRLCENQLFVDRVLSGKSDYLRRLFSVEDGKRYYL